jgi:cytoskeletal protein RodZ
LSTDPKQKKSSMTAALVAVAAAVVLAGVAGLIFALRSAPAPATNALPESSAATATASAPQQAQPQPQASAPRAVEPTTTAGASAISLESLPTVDEGKDRAAAHLRGKKDREDKAPDKAPAKTPDKTSDKVPDKAPATTNTNVPQIRDPGF